MAGGKVNGSEGVISNQRSVVSKSAAAPGGWLISVLCSLTAVLAAKLGVDGVIEDQVFVVHDLAAKDNVLIVVFGTFRAAPADVGKGELHGAGLGVPQQAGRV